MRASYLTTPTIVAQVFRIQESGDRHGLRKGDEPPRRVAMISQALRMVLFAGLVLFPTVTDTVAIDGAAAFLHHEPILCGPGPDC
jgi:hypothetical protein